MIISAASRVAVYHAPEAADPLSSLSAAWLGRDPERGVPIPQPDIPGIAEVTAEPRTYGFHATLKPPMRLRPGTTVATLMAAITDLCAGIAPFELPPLAVANVHGFLALREREPSMMLQALADLCVAGLDRFRAAPDEAELSRRRRVPLTPAQEAMLLQWGYPYVFGTWFFHMTLTRRLSADERPRYQAAAEQYFEPVLTMPRRVTEICLFTQAEPNQLFMLTERFPFRGGAPQR